MKLPLRYLPVRLTKKDKRAQLKMLMKSRKLYKKKQYYTRKKVASFKSKPSNHIAHARKIYKIDEITPNPALAQKTGCSLAALHKIVQKGEGAYFSSGSRPNQTAQSWGFARLASSITGGKAAAVDFSIIDKECNHKKTAYRLAKKARATYKSGHSHTKHTFEKHF